MSDRRVTYHRAVVRDIAPETLYRLLWLRVAVFVVEQQAAYAELDGRDIEPDTELFWVELDGVPAATLRLLRDSEGKEDGGTARIGRVATAVDARGRGLAAELMTRAVARAETRWPGSGIALDAQEHLAAWYARFGFTVSGPVYEEDGIPHVPMTRAG
ncbi:GNAT family N-acetyltransferase [Microbacterium sp. P01]|uniref:GNAT family N-acetyltransferase n=1 Tax=unclassified Microbacterium TaxID=2609290 RepID=UPI003672C2DF